MHSESQHYIEMSGQRHAPTALHPVISTLVGAATRLVMNYGRFLAESRDFSLLPMQWEQMNIRR